MAITVLEKITRACPKPNPHLRRGLGLGLKLGLRLGIKSYFGNKETTFWQNGCLREAEKHL